MKGKEENKKFKNGFEYPENYFENFPEKFQVPCPSVATNSSFPYLTELNQFPEEFPTEFVVPSEENFLQTDAFEKINTGQKNSFGLPDENYFESNQQKVKISIENFEELNTFPLLQSFYRRGEIFTATADYFDSFPQRVNETRLKRAETKLNNGISLFSFGRISIVASLVVIVIGILFSILNSANEKSDTTTCDGIACLSREEAIKELGQSELESDDLHELYSNSAESEVLDLSAEEMNGLTEAEIDEEI